MYEFRMIDIRTGPTSKLPFQKATFAKGFYTP